AAPATLLVVASVVLAAALHSHARIRLPSPLSIAEHDGVELHVADAVGTDALGGAWVGPPERFRRGAYLWFDGVGTAALDVPPRASDGSRDPQRVPSGAEATLAFGGRPDLRERR